MSAFDQNSGIAFIGAGLVGTTLAMALDREGYRIRAVASRSRASADALASRIQGCHPFATPQEAADAGDLVFITTPDDVIGPLVAELNWRRGQGVAHCSGAESLDILEPAQKQGALVGAFHPLQTFSSVEQAIKSLEGTTFAIEGEPPLQRFLEELAIALEGQHLTLAPGDKALYHISAVITCGFTITLLKEAADLWQTFGYSREEGLKALMPLLQGTLNSMASVGIPQALTGPYARGDVGTISKHLETLQARVPQSLPLYCHLALAELPIALEKGGIDAARADEMRQLLEQYLADAKSSAQALTLKR